MNTYPCKKYDFEYIPRFSSDIIRDYIDYIIVSWKNRWRNLDELQIIGRYANKYKERMTTHRNQLAAGTSKTYIRRRLRKRDPTDLTKEIK